MTGHPWFDLTAPYALGALEGEERVAFEGHLADCPICRAEVQAFREVSGVLADAVPAAAPPADLRARILREARQVRPITGRPPIIPWVAAAASVVLALVAANAYRLERSGRKAAERTIAETRDSLGVRDSLIATLLSPDVGTAGLAATGQPPSVRLFWSPSRRRVVIAAYHLPPARVGRTYQLWAIAGGKPVSLGTFNTAPTGSVRAVMDVPAGLSFQVTAVTEEPAGGSPQPTQQPFLVGKLAGGD